MKDIKLPYQKGLPCGITYPLLTLRGVQKKRGRKAEKITLWIDVNGQVDLFITKRGLERCTGEYDNAIKYARASLKRIIEALAPQGIIVEKVGTYTGSGGANYMLRNGILFRAMLPDEDK